MKHAGTVPRRRLLLLSLLCLPVATRRNAITGDAVSVVDLRIASEGDFLAFVPEALTVTAGCSLVLSP